MSSNKSPWVAGVGHSEDVDDDDALDEAIEQCLVSLEGQEPKGGILYATEEYDQERINARLAERFPNLQYIGCSADGQMSSQQGYVDDGVLLMMFGGSEAEFRAEAVEIGSAAPVAAGRAMFEALTAGGRPHLCITTPAGLTADAAELVNSMRDELGQDVPIFGGTAADHWKFQKTWQYCNGRVYEEAVPVLGFYGNLRFGHGVSSGWEAFGGNMTARSTGNILHTLDGRPALEMFRKQFGDLLKISSGECPLAVYPDANKDEYYLRAVMALDEDTGAITFAGGVPDNSCVRFTHVERDKIVDAASASAKEAVSRYRGNKPAGLMVFSCAARKWLLGNDVAKEYSVVSGITDKSFADLPVCGFYAFGEIAPKGGVSRFHNETCVSLVVGAQ